MQTVGLSNLHTSVVEVLKQHTDIASVIIHQFMNEDNNFIVLVTKEPSKSSGLLFFFGKNTFKDNWLLLTHEVIKLGHIKLDYEDMTITNAKLYCICYSGKYYQFKLSDDIWFYLKPLEDDKPDRLSYRGTISELLSFASTLNLTLTNIVDNIYYFTVPVSIKPIIIILEQG